MNRRLLPVAATLALLTLAACGDDSTVSSSDTQAAGAGAGLPEGCAPVTGSDTRVTEFTEYPPICLEDGKGYRAVVETNLGTLHIDLDATQAPLAVNSFVNLARSQYFDGTDCHRAIQGFVVQCGDPTGTGAGGPGYEFADETDGQAPYQIGSVAMANRGPDTNGSQFFIITGDDGTMLPADYTLFGQVIADDLAVVAALDAVANPQDGPPLQPIQIKSVRIEER